MPAMQGNASRERTDSLVRTVVLCGQRPFTPLCIPRASGAETQLFIKEVQAEGRRYIVCRNEAEAAKDAADRQAIVDALDQQLKRGDKALIGNSAYRRYLRATSKKAFEIDPGKLADEARYDGVFVLRTNARITPLQAVLRYRDLIQVEQLFRSAKTLMRTRPIYHSSDAAIRGHVFCSFLALILRKELDERCCKAGLRPEWGDVLRDLDRLQDVAITKDGRHITLRTPATGLIGPLFKAAHIALPPTIRERQRSLISPPRTIPCDANNRVRRRKLLAYNDCCKAGVQVQLRCRTSRSRINPLSLAASPSGSGAGWATSQPYWSEGSSGRISKPCAPELVSSVASAIAPPPESSVLTRLGLRWTLLASSLRQATVCSSPRARTAQRWRGCQWVPR